MKKSIYILVAALMLSACAGNSELLDQQEADLTKLRAELEQLDKRLKASEKQKTSISDERDKLATELETEQQRSAAFKNELERLRAEQEGNFVLGNRIVLSNAILFKPGLAVLSDQGAIYLDEVVETLAKHPNREIQIEGHSDNVPIGKGYTWKYPSNWELSAARAMAVLHHLEKERGIRSNRLVAKAYGEHRPVASNATAQGRSANRRVEIVVGPVIK